MRNDRKGYGVEGMKNQYFGDVGDYGKYAMLRFLADHGIKIAVNWYLTPNDGSNDGNITTYLDKDEMRSYDEVIFDLLKEMLSKGERSIEAFEKANVIREAVYYHAILSEAKADRGEWHQNAMKVCADAELVFLDPDNGATEIKSMKGSNKFCFPEEIADYFNAGQNVVYYCQKARRTQKQWETAKGLMQRYLPDCRIFVATYHKKPQRSYVFVLHGEDYDRYESLMTEFCHKWDGIFTQEYAGMDKVSGETTGEKMHLVNSRGVDLIIEEMKDGTVRIKRSDKPAQISNISIDDFMNMIHI